MRTRRAVSVLLDLAWAVLWIAGAWMIHPALACAVAGAFAAVTAAVLSADAPSDEPSE